MVPDLLQGKESVEVNTATCNFMTSKRWWKSQDLSERLHPQSLCFVTWNLGISCLVLHLPARTELTSGATHVVDQQMSTVGKQTRCPHGNCRSLAARTTEAAHWAGGNSATSRGEWRWACTAGRNRDSKQSAHLVGL